MSQKCNCHGNANGKYAQTVIGVLERPIYAPGLVLHDSDLTAAVDYTQSLNRMLFKHLFGCGVVCGLEVKASEHCGLKIEVSDGLALDGCGDAVHLAKPVSFTFDERETETMKKEQKTFWVVLCGKEKLCAPRALVCDADDFDSTNQMTRARAMAEVSLVFKKPECICAWQEVTEVEYKDDQASNRCVHPYPFDCAEDCGCGSACSCGCCVLLGEVSFGAKGPVAQHLNVRRIAKPQLMRDTVRCPKEAITPSERPVPPPPQEPVPAEPAPPPPQVALTPKHEEVFKQAMAAIMPEAEARAKAGGLDSVITGNYLKVVGSAIRKAIKEGVDPAVAARNVGLSG